MYRVSLVISHLESLLEFLSKERIIHILVRLKKSWHHMTTRSQILLKKKDSSSFQEIYQIFVQDMTTRVD
jgi:hypothetical protein